MRFTDKGVAALRPKAVRYEVWEDGRTGFGVRVAPSGRKSWIFMYRFDGKARRMTFGTYPAVGLSTARVKFSEAKRKLDHGEDPGLAALTEKKAEREAATIKELVDEYLQRSAKGLRGYSEVKRILEREVVPAWGRRKASSVKRRDVILLLDGIVDRSAPVMANRTLSWVRRMFKFAIAREVVEINPAAGIEKPGKETERDRVLGDVEIRGLWNGLAKADMTEAERLVTRLILVTAQRPIEVAGAKTAELDLDGECLWQLPAARAKNKRIHLLPLSPLAVQLFKEALETCAKDGVLFPSPAGDKPLTSKDISRAFLENAAPLGIPQPKPPGLDERKKLTAEEERQAKLALKAERKRISFTPHDMRRTAATQMTEMGFTRFVVDRVLNHTEQGVGRVYDRYEYLREKRAALEAWARRLEGILAGRKAVDDKVVPLRPAS
jgi:integrase